MASRSNRKTTPRPGATKALGAATHKPDPVFAAIGAHEKACAAIMAYCDRGEDVPHRLNHAKELRALARTVPQTPEGVRALGAHIAKWWYNFFNDVADPDIRAMFKALAKAMPGRAAKASAPVIDPTLAAIAAYEKSWAAFDTVVGEEAKLETKLHPIEQRLGVDITTHRPSFDVGVDRWTHEAFGGVFTGRVESEAEIKAHFAKLRKKGPPPINAGMSKRAWARYCANELRAATKRLRKAQRELKRLQDKYGWTDFERRYDATNEAANVALEKLIRTMPTTLAGLVTLAEWASKNYDDHLEGQRWNAAELCFDSLARAAKRLGRGRP
jgi:hypothetical protein